MSVDVTGVPTRKRANRKLKIRDVDPRGATYSRENSTKTPQIWRENPYLRAYIQEQGCSRSIGIGCKYMLANARMCESLSVWFTTRTTTRRIRAYIEYLNPHNHSRGDDRRSRRDDSTW